ncbi:hypothetical protein CEXT_75411 [Caerostris extrusa]|uniref:Uncharacterized protein n=1 Tax=Caerostris extrusa TaxID=172846 RepID=A0AAV4NHT3_CAEEX|nr:hypothetical protein CEXT_75411 [Caerostris extrusa]
MLKPAEPLSDQSDSQKPEQYLDSTHHPTNNSWKNHCYHHISVFSILSILDSLPSVQPPAHLDFEKIEQYFPFEKKPEILIIENFNNNKSRFIQFQTVADINKPRIYH